MPISPDFWATTAQVIPTLLLTYVVERQFTTRSDRAPRAVGTLFVASTVGLALLGEFFALRGLLGEGGNWPARMVVVSIGLLCWLIVGSFIIGYATENLPNDAETARAPLRSGVLGSFGMLAAMIVAFLPLGLAVWVAAKL